MTVYYEEIMELWKAGKFVDAISYFREWLLKGLLNDEEVGNFGKDLSKFWELVEAECEENPAVLFNLYEMVRKARNWDDEVLCKELTINKKAIEDIRNRHKPGLRAW